MRQRMQGTLTICVPDVDLTAATDLEVTLKQRSSETELSYSGAALTLTGAHELTVWIPKEDAMALDDRPMRGQVMFTLNGAPDATEPFPVSVRELLKEAGYGD